MEIERGSTWNRWDFHIHTPYSILNNQFGFAPDPDYKGDTAKFDEYVIKLFSKAVENKVVGIGITDYFSIEGYKRICREYLDKPEKMQELFPDKELRRKIAKIYVFPNIELRVDNFVGEGAHSVNYHVLFSADIPCNIIENRFISRLDLSQGNNKSIPLNRDSIEQIGRDYKSSNPDTNGIDYLVGLSKITVNHNQIIETLNKCTDFADKYIITIPVDDKLSCLPWDGRDYGTRIALYKECHCLLSSNSNTREFALAKGHEEDFIREFGSIKPCIWGSDAHNYDSMFCPAQDRFCWIKAEPTFKGLQQILYEPDERVRIQKEMPEEKDAHQIIDHIEFMHEDFQDSPIYFSEGLTAIIGGKSTGKSILLHHIAKNIDPDQAKEREELVDASNSRLEVDAKVVWKDGASGKRKIIYIPQSWLNHIVDASSGNSQLNKMLQGIILQQEEISSANIMFKNNVADILEAAKHNILDYMACHKKIEECENFLRVFGRSDAFLSTIKKLKEKRLELSVENDITEDKLNEYTKLERDIREHNESLAALKTERSK